MALALDPDVLTRRTGEGMVLVHPGTDRIHELNATGARIVELIEDGHDEAAIRATLEAAYDAPPAEIAAEVADFLARLRRWKVLVPQPEPPPDPQPDPQPDEGA